MPVVHGSIVGSFTVCMCRGNMITCCFTSILKAYNSMLLSVSGAGGRVLQVELIKLLKNTDRLDREVTVLRLFLYFIISEVNTH